MCCPIGYGEKEVKYEKNISSILLHKKREKRRIEQYVRYGKQSKRSLPKMQRNRK